MTLDEAVHIVFSYTLVKNCYMDLNGTIRPHKFPSDGMWTLFKYTNTNMSGWEFVILQDNGTDGYFTTGNSASTVENMSRYDLCVVVKTKRELKDIVQRLDWIGKYTDLGRK